MINTELADNCNSKQFFNCKTCNMMIKRGSTVCDYCGTVYDADGNQVSDPSKDKRRFFVKRNKGAFIAGIVILLVGIALLTVNYVTKLEVPNVIGMKALDATDALVSAGFTRENIKSYCEERLTEEDLNSGMYEVVYQSVDPNSRARASETISLRCEFNNDKAGFNPDANKTIEVGGCTFEIPDYYELNEENSTDDWTDYRMDDGEAIARFGAYKVTEDLLSTVNEQEEAVLDSFEEGLLGAISDNVTRDGNYYSTTINDGDPVSGKVDSYYNKDQGTIVFALLLQRDKATFDYLPDWEKVIDSRK